MCSNKGVGITNPDVIVDSQSTKYHVYQTEGEQMKRLRHWRHVEKRKSHKQWLKRQSKQFQSVSYPVTREEVSHEAEQQTGVSSK